MAAIFISCYKSQKKDRKPKRLPFKFHCHYGKSILTTQRTPHPTEGHHQISTADLPTNKQRNFIIMFNTQYVNITS